MPSKEAHCSVSRLRTGKDYKELHKWMDAYTKKMGVKHREKRHSLNDIDKVKEMFPDNPDEAEKEFLIHALMDWQNTSDKLLAKHQINIKKDRIINRGFKKIEKDFSQMDTMIGQLKKAIHEGNGRGFCHSLLDSHKKYKKNTYTSYYLNTIKRRDVWDNLNKINLKDIEEVILKFLNNWGCHIPYNRSKEVLPILNKCQELFNLLKGERLETINTQNKEGIIIDLFKILSPVLRPASPNAKKGSTATSKFMHMVNPNLFIMWDDKIRDNFSVGKDINGYIKFLKGIQYIIEEIPEVEIEKIEKETGVSILKLLDEYNWINKD